MKVKILSPANSLISPSHCWNTEATDRYDDEILSVQIRFLGVVFSWAKKLKIFTRAYKKAQRFKVQLIRRRWGRGSPHWYLSCRVITFWIACFNGSQVSKVSGTAKNTTISLSVLCAVSTLFKTKTLWPRIFSGLFTCLSAFNFLAH